MTINHQLLVLSSQTSSTHPWNSLRTLFRLRRRVDHSRTLDVQRRLSDPPSILTFRRGSIPHTEEDVESGGLVVEALVVCVGEGDGGRRSGECRGEEGGEDGEEG